MTQPSFTSDSWNSERTELEAESTRLENAVDAQPLSARPPMVERLRSALIAEGIALANEDEKVFSLFLKGTLGSRHLADHFGPRLPSILKS